MSETSYTLTLIEVSQSVHLSTESVMAIVDCGIVECVQKFDKRVVAICSSIEDQVLS